MQQPLIFLTNNDTESVWSMRESELPVFFFPLIAGEFLSSGTVGGKCEPLVFPRALWGNCNFCTELVECTCCITMTSHRCSRCVPKKFLSSSLDEPKRKKKGGIQKIFM